MQFNLFSWIREGVRQSVILGVSDAVEAIGTPNVDDDVRQRLSHLVQPMALEGASAGGGTATVAGTAKRKRLGRSLRDFDGAEE